MIPIKDYDESSFVSDVGGNLGLLLGYSMLSIYYDTVRIMSRFTWRRSDGLKI